MFTGIIEELGEVLALDGDAGGARLRVRARAVLDGARIGESIAVNGACLTVVAAQDGVFTVDLSAETLRRTTLGALRAGDPVNLERPLRLDQRVGGHIVQGHVDGVGTIAATRPEGEGIWMEIMPPPALMPYLAEKGSVAVDGISLTVAGITNGARPAQGDITGGARFAVALIPHTLAVTTLGRRRPGDPVNIEVDILAKYVERLLEGVRNR